MSEQRCLICSRETVTGLRINTCMLCWDCEAELLRTEVTDPKYELFVKKLKQVWPQRQELQHMVVE